MEGIWKKCLYCEREEAVKMKYFLIRTEDGNQTPRLKDWFGAINLEKINLMPEWTIFEIYEESFLLFPDILSSPYFLVSEKVKEIISLYSDQTMFKKVILLDKKNKKSKLYYLPILERIHCLAKQSSLDKVKSKIFHGVIEIKKTKNLPILQVDDVSTTYVAARLDLVESILRREPKGIKLEELIINGSGGINCVNINRAN